MNITVIRLVIVTTSTGFVVMCKILTVVVAFFECARVNSTFLGRDSLPLVLITILIRSVARHMGTDNKIDIRSSYHAWKSCSD